MKPYKLQFVSRSEKEFLQLPKSVRERIRKKMEEFLQSGDPLHFAKKLGGYHDLFRFRIGDYRLLVRSKDERKFIILLIIKVGHRREVYKGLS